MDAKPDLLMLGPYNDPEMAMLAERFTLHRLWEAADRDAALARLAPGLRAVATKGEIGADAGLMDSLPKLEIVACYGVGVDAIDLGRAKARGVRVTNTPDVLTEDVADMAWALLLAAARRIPAGDAHVRNGAWAGRGAMEMTTRVWGKRLGVVGLGNIGRAVAKRAEGFGMRIAYSGRGRKEGSPYDWHPDPASLAAASDMLVVCAQGGPATKGLVGAKAIAALGPAGILVNVSRGTVVDEAALLDALENGRLAAAGLDVFLNEPRIDQRFLSLENVVLQPHNSSGTRETRMAMAELVRDNLLAHFAGKPPLTPVA
ncbi:MAG: 2-hydroxyacid dehydrogenase [Acetobacteraceae bacterium]|nr:2-hydroxyacid dehydrogenase [Acetobacteraceae bacterium]